MADELTQARETIRTLNRRCQSAEAGLAVKLDEMQRAGQSLGRGFANSAAAMYLAQRDEARTSRDAWKAWAEHLLNCRSCYTVVDNPETPEEVSTFKPCAQGKIVRDTVAALSTRSER